MNSANAIELIKAKGAELCPGFAMDDDNDQVIITLAAWLAREPRQGMDLNKGILLIGNVGTGKSLLLRILRAAMRDAYGSQFGIKSCSELVRSFTDDGYEEINPWMNAPHVCFDDLGTENRGTHYAAKTNLMAEIIEARYDRLTAGKKCWTHFSTNLGLDDIEKLYGPRAFSRLRHMCNVLDLGADAKARDRRAGAAGISQPVIPPNADNIYSLVHPKIAARLQAALKPAIDALQVKNNPQMRVVANIPSQANDLQNYAVLCQDATVEQLQAERKAILLNNTPGAAGPFVNVIDNELQERAKTTPELIIASEVTFPVVGPTTELNKVT